MPEDWPDDRRHPEALSPDWGLKARSAHIHGEKVPCPRDGFTLTFTDDNEAGRINGWIIQCEFCGLRLHVLGRTLPD